MRMNFVPIKIKIMRLKTIKHYSAVGNHKAGDNFLWVHHTNSPVHIAHVI